MHKHPKLKMDESHNVYKYQNKLPLDFALLVPNPEKKKKKKCNINSRLMISCGLIYTRSYITQDYLLTLMVIDIIVVSSSSVSMYSINPFEMRSCHPSSELS